MTRVSIEKTKFEKNVCNLKVRNFSHTIYRLPNLVVTSVNNIYVNYHADNFFITHVTSIFVVNHFNLIILENSLFVVILIEFFYLGNSIALTISVGKEN